LSAIFATVQGSFDNGNTDRVTSYLLNHIRNKFNGIADDERLWFCRLLANY